VYEELTIPFQPTIFHRSVGKLSISPRLRSACYKTEHQTDLPDSERALLPTLISQLLSTSIASEGFFVTYAQPRPTSVWINRPPQPNESRAHSHIQACVATGNESLIGAVLKTLRTSTDLDPRTRMTEVFLPLISVLQLAPRTWPAEVSTIWQSFCADVVQEFLGRAVKDHRETRGSERVLGDKSVDSLVYGVIAGDVEWPSLLTTT
jgi:hypothetical protein